MIMRFLILILVLVTVAGCLVQPEETIKKTIIPDTLTDIYKKSQTCGTSIQCEEYFDSIDEKYISWTGIVNYVSSDFLLLHVKFKSQYYEENANVYVYDVDRTTLLTLNKGDNIQFSGRLKLSLISENKKYLNFAFISLYDGKIIG